MKKKLLLAAATVFMALSASAQNKDECSWMEQPTPSRPDTASRTSNLEFLSVQELKLAPVGTSMGRFELSYYSRGHKAIVCPIATVPMVDISYWLTGAALVPGYSDVYSTNLPGIGFRITQGGTMLTVPFNKSSRNAVAAAYFIGQLYIDFIRTAFEIKTGNLDLNFTLYTRFHDWTALTLSAGSNVALTTKEYFSGCTGAPTTTIPLDKVNVQDLAQRKKRRFNLEVVCAGAPAGSKLPVKAYFEGSNNGAGRLQLTPGGATGVEIALISNNVRLPFSAANALAMDWLRTEPGGERYSMPIDAGYERIGTNDVTVGQANGTVNYVIQYN